MGGDQAPLGSRAQACSYLINQTKRGRGQVPHPCWPLGLSTPAQDPQHHRRSHKGPVGRRAREQGARRPLAPTLTLTWPQAHSASTCRRCGCRGRSWSGRPRWCPAPADRTGSQRAPSGGSSSAPGYPQRPAGSLMGRPRPRQAPAPAQATANRWAQAAGRRAWQRCGQGTAGSRRGSRVHSPTGRSWRAGTGPGLGHSAATLDNSPVRRLWPSPIAVRAEPPGALPSRVSMVCLGKPCGDPGHVPSRKLRPSPGPTHCARWGGMSPSPTYTHSPISSSPAQTATPLTSKARPTLDTRPLRSSHPQACPQPLVTAQSRAIRALASPSLASTLPLPCAQGDPVPPQGSVHTAAQTHLCTIFQGCIGHL